MADTSSTMPGRSGTAAEFHPAAAAPAPAMPRRTVPAAPPRAAFWQRFQQWAESEAAAPRPGRNPA